MYTLNMCACVQCVSILLLYFRSELWSTEDGVNFGFQVVLTRLSSALISAFYNLVPFSTAFSSADHLDFFIFKQYTRQQRTCHHQAAGACVSSFFFFFHTLGEKQRSDSYTARLRHQTDQTRRRSPLNTSHGRSE